MAPSLIPQAAFAGGKREPEALLESLYVLLNEKGTVQMVSQLATRRVSIRLAHVLFIIVIACGAFGAGLLLRPWGSSAAPGGNVEACVSRYTGAVRMSPYGATTCNSGETKVSWPASKGVPSFRIREQVIPLPAVLGPVPGTSLCEAGETATGGGYALSSSTTLIVTNQPESTESTPVGWTIEAVNVSANPTSFTVYAICMSASAAP